MAELNKYRRAALEAKPANYYEIRAEKLRADDLVWSWTSKEWLRADSPLWKFSPLKFAEDLICVVRKAQISEFEQGIEKKKIFRLTR